MHVREQLPGGQGVLCLRTVLERLQVARQGRQQRGKDRSVQWHRRTLLSARPISGLLLAHLHLRSPNPDATAKFFETMFSAEAKRDIYPPGTLYPGQQRISLILGGQKILIAPTHPDDAMTPAPAFPYYGLEHIGLTV